MSGFVPESLARAKDSRVVVDAVYFVVRTLRNVQRNYPDIQVSPESSSEAHTLAEMAIGEIEDFEKKSIRTISRSEISQYLSALQEFVSKRTNPDTHTSQVEAQEFLEKMRLRDV